jgi:hypothetical protein
VDVAIDTAQMMARIIEEEATLRDLVTLLKLREGEVSVSEVTVSPSSKIIGKAIKNVGLPERCVIAAILRGSNIPKRGGQVTGAGLERFRVGALCVARDAEIGCDLKSHPKKNPFAFAMRLRVTRCGSETREFCFGRHCKYRPIMGSCTRKFKKLAAPPSAAAIIILEAFRFRTRTSHLRPRR